MTDSRCEFFGWSQAFDATFTTVPMMPEVVHRPCSCLAQVQAIRTEMQELRTLLHGIAEKLAAMAPEGAHQDIASARAVPWLKPVLSESPVFLSEVVSQSHQHVFTFMSTVACDALTKAGVEASIAELLESPLKFRGIILAYDGVSRMSKRQRKLKKNEYLVIGLRVMRDLAVISTCVCGSAWTNESLTSAIGDVLGRQLNDEESAVIVLAFNKIIALAHCKDIFVRAFRDTYINALHPDGPSVDDIFDVYRCCAASSPSYKSKTKATGRRRSVIRVRPKPDDGDVSQDVLSCPSATETMSEDAAKQARLALIAPCAPPPTSLAQPRARVYKI